MIRLLRQDIDRHQGSRSFSGGLRSGREADGESARPAGHLPSELGCYISIPVGPPLEPDHPFPQNFRFHLEAGLFFSSRAFPLFASPSPPAPTALKALTGRLARPCS